ncbi:MAG: glycoside hydrolase family 13 protein [Flavobacteriales bacterium]
MKPCFLYSFILLFIFSCQSKKNKITPNHTQNHKNTLAFDQPPEWAKTAIWYQIFVERFQNGDSNNDPTLQTIEGSWPHKKPENWQVSNWTSNWYKQPQWEKETGKEFYTTVQMRRYGGDLQGVLNQLDYIQSLGVNALYFNPLNDSPSLHKYDARSYHHIDVTFGPDPKGDLQIIASEDPNDPNTWKWTSADKLFLKVIEEAHKRNIKIVLDYSWNHTGSEFWAWRDILENQEKSKYKDWYLIDSFKTDSTELQYKGWAEVKELPELAKTNVKNRKHGHPYDGNIPDPVKNHIFAVNKRWLAPNGQISNGVDGFRLDVADQVPMDFWRDYRKFVRSINPETILVGEVWWEEWPDKLMDPRPYLGNVFDIIMHYQQYVPAREFFAKAYGYGGAEKFKSTIEKIQNEIPENVLQSMMAMSASHDSPRLLTSFFNRENQYKVGSTQYKKGKPNSETYDRVKLYLAHQYTFIGAPQIWNGDEMGMWGSDDPDCRKPLWWKDLHFEKETNLTNQNQLYEVKFNQDLYLFYQKLIKIRNENPVLATGKLEFLKAEGDLLVYKRFNVQNEIIILFNNSNEEMEWDGPILKGKDLFQQKEIILNKKGKLAPKSFTIIKIH